MSERILEQFLQPVLVLLLIIIGEKNLQEIRKGFLLQAPPFGNRVDIENPFRQRSNPCLSSKLLDLSNHILIAESVEADKDLSHNADQGLAAQLAPLRIRLKPSMLS